MLITDKFVVLNFPKTGSTFVRTVIRKISLDKLSWVSSFFFKLLTKYNLLYPKGYKELFLSHPILMKGRNQHAPYYQIPAEFKNREVLSVVRDPYDRFLSMYKYGWWKKEHNSSKSALKGRFPDFPNLSLEDFFQFKKMESELIKKKFHIPQETQIGAQSITFIKMFSKDPISLFSRLTNVYLNDEAIYNEFAEITFLRQENLNKELAGFLQKFGYDSDSLNLIESHNKENVSREPKNFQHANHEELKSIIRKEEWFLYKVLKRNGIEY